MIKNHRIFINIHKQLLQRLGIKCKNTWFYFLFLNNKLRCVQLYKREKKQ